MSKEKEILVRLVGNQNKRFFSLTDITVSDNKVFYRKNFILMKLNLSSLG